MRYYIIFIQHVERLESSDLFTVNLLTRVSLHCVSLQISLHALNRKKDGKVTRQDLLWALSDSNIVMEKIPFEAVWKYLGGGIAPDAEVEIKLIVRQLSM